MADITETLQNQQALSGGTAAGKLVRTMGEDGEVQRRGKAATMLKLIEAGAKPGNPEDAADLLSKMDTDTAKSILTEYGLDPDAIKGMVMDVLKEYKVTPEQVAEATGTEVKGEHPGTQVLGARRAQDEAVPQGTPVSHVKVEKEKPSEEEGGDPTTYTMMPQSRRRNK